MLCKKSSPSCAKTRPPSNPNRKIFEARKRETAALGTGEKLVLGHPLAATIGCPRAITKRFRRESLEGKNENKLMLM